VGYRQADINQDCYVNFEDLAGNYAELALLARSIELSIINDNCMNCMVKISNKRDL